MTTDAVTQLIGREFPQDTNLQYFNHAAMGPWPMRTRAAVAKFASQCGNDLLQHWRHWYATEQELRERLGRLLGTVDGATGISMTKNTTEGLSLIATGLPWNHGDQVLILQEEFSSNRWSWQQCTPVGVSVIEVERHPGQLIHEALINASGANTRLISVSTVQYISGTALNLAALSEFCRQRNIVLIIDAIQSLGALPLDLKATPVDAVACGAHKWLMAAEGLGFLYTSESLRNALAASQAGWRMASEPFQFPSTLSDPAQDGRILEAGTLNTVGMIALDASLSLYEEVGSAQAASRILRNTRYLIDVANAKGLIVATPADPDQHAGIVSVKYSSEDKTLALFKFLSERKAVCTLRGGFLRMSAHYSTPWTQVEQLGQWLSEHP